MGKTNRDVVATTTPEITPETTPEITPETNEVEKLAVDPQSEWPTIYIPKKNKNDDQRIFSINFKEYIVKTGQHVKVPPALYKVYMNSLKAEEICEKNENESIG